MSDAPERVWITEGYVVPDDIHDPETFDETEYIRFDIHDAAIAHLGEWWKSRTEGIVTELDATIARLTGILGKGTLEMLAERDDTIERLREYARHDEGCNGEYGEQYRCRCGWREFKAELGE